jgi:Papain family cysteine protease
MDHELRSLFEEEYDKIHSCEPEQGDVWMFQAKTFGRKHLALLAGLLVLLFPGAGYGQKTLPRSVSLIAEFNKFGLVPRAQGERDTCSLFAITSLAEFECARQSPQATMRLSEEFLIWAGNEASGLKGDQAMFYKAVHGLNTYGICAEERMPYANKSEPKRRPSAQALTDAKERSVRWKVEWVKRWSLERPLTDAEMLNIKKALAAGHPVACGFRWPKALKGHEILEVLPVDKVFDGHSVALVGYEDNPQKAGGGIFWFRNSYGPRWGDNGYGAMCYAYARAYANDALWLQYAPPHSEVPVERFEAETLQVLASQKCATNAQKMDAWGGRMWSKGEQLFCAAQKGGFVELGFTVHKAGRYRLRVLATAAPDFGRIRMALDGKALERDFDLYCGKISPAGSLELGTHDFSAGPHRLRFTATGKNIASANFFIGLDAVDLLAAK